MSTPTAQSVATRDKPEGARQIGPAKAFIANLEPDWCFADAARTELVAFNIVAAFQDEVRPHPNVRMTYLPTITKVSRISAVVGNEAGIGGGLRSGVCKGWCRPVDGCASVLINGQRVIRHDDLYWMNCDGPEGPANCLGEVIYVVQGAGGHAYDAATGEEVILGRDLRLPVLRPETEAEASWLQKTLSSPAVLFTLGALQVLGGAAEVVVAVGVGGGAELFSGGIATPVALPAAALIGAHGLSEIYAGAEMMVTLTPTQTPAAAGMAWGLEQAGYQRDRAELVGSLLDAAMGIGIGLGGSKLITGAPQLAQETGGLVDELVPPPGAGLIDGPSPLQGPAGAVQTTPDGLPGNVWSRSDEGLLYLDDGPRVPLAYDGSGNPLYTADEASKALGAPTGGLKVTLAGRRYPPIKGLTAGPTGEPPPLPEGYMWAKMDDLKSLLGGSEGDIGEHGNAGWSISRLADAIETDGFDLQSAILVAEADPSQVVDGMHRLGALKAAGFEYAPVRIAGEREVFDLMMASLK